MDATASTDLLPAATPPATPPGARTLFLSLLAERVAEGRWEQLVLTRPHRAEPELERVIVRPVLLRGAAVMSFVYRYKTRDITRNLALQPGLAQAAALLDGPFRNAHLHTEGAEHQLTLGKRGEGRLVRHAIEASASEDPQDGALGADGAARADANAGADPPSDGHRAHDRARHRLLDPHRPFLHALGVTTAHGEVIPSMARKWKQINRFVEIFAAALASSTLAGRADLRVVDFGAGRGYLTFALHDWLRSGPAPAAEVSGVELRADLVAEGRQSIARLGLAGLQMVQGEIGRFPLPQIDVMIALHACDTATDDALHAAVKAGAQIILSSPCCHKQLRGQLLSPHPLRPVFRHGIHAEQQAEMLTDSLRALLLEAEGYDTQVFEFISLEHTRKNKMILANRRARPAPEAQAEARRQVEALKAFFGVREQRLQQLLEGSPQATARPLAVP